MKEDIINILEFNLLSELKKKQLTKPQRKMLIDDYTQRNKLSIRGLATSLHIPHTTLYGWIHPEIKEKQIEKQRLQSIDKQLKLFKTTFEVYKKKIENQNLKCSDTTRELIEEVKNLAVWVYQRTRKISF